MSVIIPENYFHCPPNSSNPVPIFFIDGEDIVIDCKTKLTCPKDSVFLVKATQSLSEDFLRNVPGNVAIMFFDESTAEDSLRSILVAERLVTYFLCKKDNQALEVDVFTNKFISVDEDVTKYFLKYHANQLNYSFLEIKNRAAAHNAQLDAPARAEAIEIIDKVKEILEKTNVLAKRTVTGCFAVKSDLSRVLKSLKETCTVIEWYKDDQQRVISWVAKFDD